MPAREKAMHANDRRRESGSALLVAVLLMALMGVVGLSSMDIVTQDRRIAGFQKRAQTALYAAEAGVAFGVGLIRRDAPVLATQGEGALQDYNPSAGGTPSFPPDTAPQTLGSDFPAPGSPSFSMDPNASDPNNPTAPPQAIRYMGKGDACPGWIMSADEASIEWAEALWDIRVQGRNPGGTTIRIQATGTNCHPYE